MKKMIKKVGYFAGLVGIALANQGCLTYAMSLGASNPYVSPRTRALCRVAADTNRSLDNSKQNYRLDRLESGGRDEKNPTKEELIDMIAVYNYKINKLKNKLSDPNYTDPIKRDETKKAIKDLYVDRAFPVIELKHTYNYLYHEYEFKEGSFILKKEYR